MGIKRRKVPQMLWLLWIAALCLSVGVLAATILAWQSSGSRTVSLAVAALIGATVLFWVQIKFELGSQEQVETTEVQFEVEYLSSGDGNKERLRILDSMARESRRELYSYGTQDLIYRGHLKTLDGIQETLVKEYAVSDVLLFFRRIGFDWQLTLTRAYNLTQGGVFQIPHGASKPGDYEEVTDDSVQSLAKAASFVSFHQMSGGFKLPPRTQITLVNGEAPALAMKNDFGELRFDITLADGTRQRPDPDEIGADVLGRTRLVWSVIVVITNRQSRLYRYHRDAAKYSRWRTWTAENLKWWLTSSPTSIWEPGKGW